MYGELTELGHQLLFISTDRPEKSREATETSGPAYTLLSDSKLAAAQALGIAFRLNDEMLELYKRYDIDLAAASGETHQMLPVPSVFVLDKKAMIHFQYVNPNYKVRIAPSVLLAAAKSALK